eukprot:g3462.t1
MWYLAFAVFFVLFASFSTVKASIHPCQKQRPSVRKGGSFDVGLVFWTDATYEDWGSVEDGRHPCSDSDRESWNPDEVLISYFRIEVDKLTLLDTVNKLQNEFLEGKNNVTVTAFSGGYRSEPKVVRIRDGDNWNVIRSLALTADFDKEGLLQLQWFDIECGDCQRGDQCLSFQKQKSCATRCENSNQTKCRTEIFISFDGVDRKDQVLNSATQIRKLRRASVSHLYESSREFASSAMF